METKKKKTINLGAILAMVLIAASLTCTFLGLVSISDDATKELVDFVELAEDELPDLRDISDISRKDYEILESAVEKVDATLTDGSISILDIIALQGTLSEIMDADGIQEEIQYDHTASTAIEAANGVLMAMTIGLIVVLCLLGGFGLMALINNLTGGKWWTMIYPLVWTIFLAILWAVVLLINGAIDGISTYEIFELDEIFSISPFAYIALATAYAGFILRFATIPKKPKTAPVSTKPNGYNYPPQAPAYNPYGQPQQSYTYGQQPQQPYVQSQQPSYTPAPVKPEEDFDPAEAPTQFYAPESSTSQEVPDVEKTYNPAEEQAAFLQTPGEHFCVSCNWKLEAGTKFCPICGTKQP